MGLFTLNKKKTFNSRRTRHHLHGLRFCLKTMNNYSIVLVTVTRMSCAAFAVVLLILLPSSQIETSSPRLCNSDPCFPSGWCIRPTPVCRVRAVFALSELYLSFSSPSGCVCESRQAVFAERFVIIRRVSLGQRSRAPLPGYANSPSLPPSSPFPSMARAQRHGDGERDRGERKK